MMMSAQNMLFMVRLHFFCSRLYNLKFGCDHVDLRYQEHDDLIFRKVGTLNKRLCLFVRMLTKKYNNKCLQLIFLYFFGSEMLCGVNKIKYVNANMHS